MAREVDRCLWQLGPVSEGPRCHPGLWGDSGLCPIPRGVNQMSRVTLARIRGPVGLTRCPGTFALGPRARGVNQLSWMTGACV